MTHVNTSENCQNLHSALPKWLRDPFDLEGKPARDASRAAARAKRQEQEAQQHLEQQQPLLEAPANQSEPIILIVPLAFGETANRLGYKGPKAGEPIDLSLLDEPSLIDPQVTGAEIAYKYIVKVVILNQNYPNPQQAPRKKRKPRLKCRRHKKVFGDGSPRPMDRNLKARIKVRLRILARKVKVNGRLASQITYMTYQVGMELVYGFHNAVSGLCYPSYETIAKKVGCCRDSVCEAIKSLEAAGVLSWENRLLRMRIEGRLRLIRTSNSYYFNDPTVANRSELSKSENPTGTINQEIKKPSKKEECNNEFCESTKSRNPEAQGAPNQPLLT